MGMIGARRLLLPVKASASLSLTSPIWTGEGGG
ncbi:unnamed protein product [Tetraodon nigroviridis]|uniref:(spotted green pufferfish) hypothetical protein n=1 Tax=Tetraodon nigroviridis TaxID=99883 RepID=Q4RYM3_TETNG|nr:unnamed protein product [Tetraodon nigroviridis]